MKQLFQLLFFLVTTTQMFSQDFDKVDTTVLSYPKFSKVEDLAHQINNDFSKDIHKARAAFFWLAKNIRYNLKEYYNPKQRSYRFHYATEEEKEQKLQALKDQLIATAFGRKTGVCEEYAQSFKKICDLMGVEAEVIKGNVRNNVNDIGEISTTTNHAWNAVKIDGKWILLDATWAAGYENNGRWTQHYNDYFFDIPKDKIFKTHLPDNSPWILRFGRITREEFYNQPIFSNYFLASKAILTRPTNGIISISSQEKIKLYFKDLDAKSDIYYGFKGMKYLQKPAIIREENSTTITILNPKKNTNLVIFINRKEALQFKIRMQ